MSKQYEKRTMKTHKPETQVFSHENDLARITFWTLLQEALRNEDMSEKIKQFVTAKWGEFKNDNHAQETKETEKA